MTTNERNAYNDGWLKGKDWAYEKVKEAVDGNGHSGYCNCFPCLAVRLVWEDVLKELQQRLREEGDSPFDRCCGAAYV